jgi:hypothetical protein
MIIMEIGYTVSPQKKIWSSVSFRAILFDRCGGKFWRHKRRYGVQYHFVLSYLIDVEVSSGDTGT